MLNEKFKYLLAPTISCDSNNYNNIIIIIIVFFFVAISSLTSSLEETSSLLLAASSSLLVIISKKKFSLLVVVFILSPTWDSFSNNNLCSYLWEQQQKQKVISSRHRQHLCILTRAVARGEKQFCTPTHPLRRAKKVCIQREWIVIRSFYQRRLILVPKKNLKEN